MTITATAVGASVVHPHTLLLARLKVTLLAEGLRLSEPARAVLSASAKPALRVRSGSCGGIDLILADGSFVNAPVNERFAKLSPLELRSDEEGDVRIHDSAGRFDDAAVATVPAPAYYSACGSDGSPLHRTGQLCSDRLGIGLTNVCTFWRSEARRCRFCSIGHNTTSEIGTKRLGIMLEAVDAAYEDAVVPARHLLLGGGTPDGEDAGAVAIAELAAAVKRRWSQPIYAMIAPPRDLAYLELLRDSGVDEIGLNVELFSAEAAARFVPGKHATTGLDGYLAALERAVELFGPVNTRSITVVGLESAAATIAGVSLLASMGVLPILSPFRALAGTDMEHHPMPSAAALWELTLGASEAAASYDMPLGPVCIACQSNTLTVPGHPSYRFY